MSQTDKLRERLANAVVHDVTHASELLNRLMPIIQSEINALVGAAYVDAASGYCPDCRNGVSLSSIAHYRIVGRTTESWTCRALDIRKRTPADAQRELKRLLQQAKDKGYARGMGDKEAGVPLIHGREELDRLLKQREIEGRIDEAAHAAEVTAPRKYLSDYFVWRVGDLQQEQAALKSAASATQKKQAANE